MKRSFKTLVATTLLVLVTTSLLTACSGGPGEKEVQTQVVASLKAEGMDDLYEVKNLKKLDARKIDSSNYQVKMGYDLHFKTGLKELAAKTMREAKGFDVFDATVGLEMLKEEYGIFKAGEIQHKKRDFLFVKTEKGWRLAL